MTPFGRAEYRMREPRGGKSLRTRHEMELYGSTHGQLRAGDILGAGLVAYPPKQRHERMATTIWWGRGILTIVHHEPCMPW